MTERRNTKRPKRRNEMVGKKLIAILLVSCLVVQGVGCSSCSLGADHGADCPGRVTPTLEIFAAVPNIVVAVLLFANAHDHNCGWA